MRLPRIRSGLLTHQLDDQFLIYDRRVDRVHLLDPTTASVLVLLQEGGWTAEGIAVEAAERLGTSPAAGFLPLAIEELRVADLLDEASIESVAPIDANRRDMLRKVAMAGATAMLVPVITTLTATNGYSQGTGTAATCSACTQSSQCQGGLTCGTSGACGSNLFAAGTTCSASSECCSNNCKKVEQEFRTCQP
jgi:hypothetical protein